MPPDIITNPNIPVVTTNRSRAKKATELSHDLRGFLKEYSKDKNPNASTWLNNFENRLKDLSLDNPFPGLKRLRKPISDFSYKEGGSLGGFSSDSFVHLGKGYGTNDNNTVQQLLDPDLVATVTPTKLRDSEFDVSEIDVSEITAMIAAARRKFTEVALDEAQMSHAEIRKLK